MTLPETASPERASRAAASRAAAARAAALARLGSAPEVIFDEGRFDRATHVRMGEFDGPLALLLALIEARQLDVLTVPLGGLAEAYLDALGSLEGDRLGSVSGFVAVAAQLILIKSRAILPRPPKVVAVPLDEEPDPEAELRARLIEYRRFRDAGAALGRAARRASPLPPRRGGRRARRQGRGPPAGEAAASAGGPARGAGQAGEDRSACAARRRDRHQDRHSGGAGGGDSRGALPGGSCRAAGAARWRQGPRRGRRHLPGACWSSSSAARSRSSRRNHGARSWPGG